MPKAESNHRCQPGNARHWSGDSTSHRRPRRPCAWALACGLLALPVGNVGAEVANAPLTVTTAVRPLVLFALSRDHQLYKKAYNDYSDLNSDGVLELTYANTYSYSGYFDPDRCYTYDAAGYFSPAGVATNHQCTLQWSGNLLNWASMTRMDILRQVLYGGYRSVDTTTQTVLERALIPTDVHAFVKVFAPAGAGVDMAKYTPYNDASLSFCNVTYAAAGETQSLDLAANPPLIRIATGQWPMWASGEIVECAWREEQNNITAPQKASNRVLAGTANGLKARVEVCVATKEEGNCKRYPQAGAAKKPIGLLQRYGEDGSLRFGLMSGSYKKNKSGGVLRRNVDRIAGNATAAKNEINLQTGQFYDNPGIRKTIDSLRINKYAYGSHNYQDSCASPGILSFNDGACTNWGNPVAEIYLEALRYLAGKGSATAAFNADDSSYFGALSPVAWVDPMPAEEWCALSNIVILGSGVNSFDGDQLASDIAGLNAATATNVVGTAEGISGNYLLGGNTGQCTAKNIAGMADATGVCPEGPSLEGVYQVAGLSYFARTNDLRADRQGEQTISTRAVALARDIPRFQIPVGNNSITLLPHAEANSNANATQASAGWRNASLADLYLESLVTNAQGRPIKGSIRMMWEDSTWGNDYDMDGVQRLEFCVGPTQCNDATVLADEIKVATSVQQVYAGHTLLFGFTVTGSVSGSTPTNAACDGVYHGDGVYREVVRKGSVGNFSCLVNDNCARKPADCVRKFRAGTSAAGLLQNPLWYAAKYGSYNEANHNSLPDVQTEWDSDQDGDPDGFFFADNPAQLGPAIGHFLDIISATSSSASVVANSLTLSSGTKIYQAQFNSADWSGDLIAFPLDANGRTTTPDWQARERLNLQNCDSGRRILTSTAAAASGVAFRWANLTAAQKTALNTNPDTGAVELDAIGQKRVNYLRGCNTDELAYGGDFRDRSYALGDIVNSEPVYVGPAQRLYPDTLVPASPYSTFVDARANRPAMIFAGANDGMLHAFAADTGDERMAYIPRAVYANLSRLTSQNYRTSHRFFVDGEPVVGDVYMSGRAAWNTVLVAGLAAGGKGVFALDVTDPASFLEANAGSRVLWDHTDADAGFTDLGYSFSSPALVRTPDDSGGTWAAVFGNGFGSTNGKAMLYLVNTETGAQLDAVEAHAGPNNGLASVAPVDYDGDLKADYVYAGDLQGNLWRFEPRHDGTDRWTLSFDGLPLFMARDANGAVQPITARPEVMKHPQGGVLVLFGTGKYFETVDGAPNLAVVNSLYGIWDRMNGTNSILRDHLLQQTFLAATSSYSYDLRVSSQNTVTWHSDIGKPAGNPPATQLGWYLDLLTPSGQGLSERGELSVTDPQLRAGRIIVTTMIPSTQSCDFGGDGWLVELMAADGKAPSTALYDLNNDGAFGAADLVTADIPVQGGGTLRISVAPSAKKSLVGIIQEPAIVAAGGREYKYASGAVRAQIDITGENPGGSAGGRSAWSQLR